MQFPKLGGELANQNAYHKIHIHPARVALGDHNAEIEQS
jgi:hypothetical protein